MAGPFPGMDPYLEDPAYWQGVHNRLIDYIDSVLNKLLPEPYAAYTEVRCYIERSEDSIRPDVLLQTKLRSTVKTGGSGAALADASDIPLHFEVWPIESREAYISIRDVTRKQRVITTIEMLSHANKTTRNDGRRLYREKQEKILASESHLIEIDLLRAGTFTAAVPLTVFEPGENPDYLVCLHRAKTGGAFDVWPVNIRQRLPRIDVPLEEGVPDVVLDLQAVMDRAYDEGSYIRKTDYTQSPVPPLKDDDRAWADAVLKERGLR
jgi:hypothetical protein